MNISEHIGNFKQEMKRRNFAQNTIDNYVSCLNVFFGKSKKDHPKNINERDIKDFLVQFAEVNTQRNYHSAIKKFYDVCLGQSDKFKYIPYARKNEKLPIVLSVEEIQKMSRFELLLLFVRRGDYGRSFYLSSVVEILYGKGNFIDKVKAMSLYRLTS